MGTTTLHDAEVVGLDTDRAGQRLRLLIVDAHDRRKYLSFEGVITWLFTPFEDQNVLYKMERFAGSSLPDHLEEEMPSKLVDCVRSGEWSCYWLDASVGLGGWIVARDAKLLDRD